MKKRKKWKKKMKRKKPGLLGGGLPFCWSITIKIWILWEEKKERKKEKEKEEKKTRVCFKTNR